MIQPHDVLNPIAEPAFDERAPSRTAILLEWLLPESLRLIASLFVLLVLLFQVLRLCLYVGNQDLADTDSLAMIAKSFLIGLWFDLATASYTCIPILAASKLAQLVVGPTGERRSAVIGAAGSGVVFVVLGLAELEFYREFASRYNTLAVQFWGHGSTVVTMIWDGFPVIRYLLVAILLAGAFGAAAWRVGRFWIPKHGPAFTQSWHASVAPTVWGLLLLIVAARGGLRPVPLQWSDSVHCESTFANQLSLNGFWSLSSGLMSYFSRSHISEHWKKLMPIDEGLDCTQRLLIGPDEELAGDPNYPLLRTRRNGERSVSLARQEGRQPNVVVILMESFSARFVGALGTDRPCTPDFDRLAEHGILFERCFSAGWHTHQANVAVGACFPNLPGYECLMQSDMASQPFDSLPRAFKQQGYQTMFIYNGDLAWDGVRGFFKAQGIDRFIGRSDFEHPIFMDATWGVSDQDMLVRAHEEFTKAKEPFYATVLTATNHSPYRLPQPLPFPEITGFDNWNRQMNGIRYQDWSIGRFFELARSQPYFQNTLFVLVGDHGYSVKPILTELNLLRFHVPLLFYSPALLGDEPRRRRTVSSHVNIGPTVLGLVGDPHPHQHWGRDLFAVPDDDPGFAVFKPSFSGQAVGFARGDDLLIKHTSGEARLYRYDFGFPPSLTPVTPSNDQIRSQLQRDLEAYVQTALEVLTRRHVYPREAESQ